MTRTTPHAMNESSSIEHISLRTRTRRTPLRAFLSQNPFPQPMTLGFFYREKMRAIHHIAPDHPLERILEVGGGRSGLAAMLYPEAAITNLDVDPVYASAPCNAGENVQFVVGDAVDLPFADGSFDAVTMFDLLEHVEDDGRAVTEALRVLRPGGFLLVSTPNEHWRFPYHSVLKPICPSEEEMFARWGHVRRGYAVRQLQELIASPPLRSATFITPLTVLGHDIAFSNLPFRLRRALCAALSPLTWLGYAVHRAGGVGTETASLWQKPVEG